MKRILASIFIVIILLIVVGCGRKMTPVDAVEDYLDLYRNNDKEVIKQLDEFVEKEYLNEEQKKLYIDVMKREYSSIKYEIIQEKYEGEYAYVTVKINVLYLYSAQRDAIMYLNNNQEEFLNEDGSYDKDKFNIYKLNAMKNTDETVNYEINFKLLNTDDNWEVIQLSNDDLEKIHGIYDYSEE